MFQGKGREAGWLIATVRKRNIFYLHSLISKKRSYITVSRPWTKLKVVLVETHKLEMKGSIYFSNNQCKILYQDEYLFVCVVILHYRSNKCIQCPIWRQIQPIHCIHYIWRHWFWLANGYIRKPRVLSYVIKNSCRKVQQYSSWEKGIGLFIFIDLTKWCPAVRNCFAKKWNISPKQFPYLDTTSKRVIQTFL